jgi:hypothetical protein
MLHIRPLLTLTACALVTVAGIAQTYASTALPSASAQRVIDVRRKGFDTIGWASKAINDQLKTRSPDLNRIATAALCPCASARRAIAASKIGRCGTGHRRDQNSLQRAASDLLPLPPRVSRGLASHTRAQPYPSTPPRSADGGVQAGRKRIAMVEHGRDTLVQVWLSHLRRIAPALSVQQSQGIEQEAADCRDEEPEMLRKCSSSIRVAKRLLRPLACAESASDARHPIRLRPA